MSHIRSLNAVTLFRIAFGIVWLIDGAMKFVWLQPSDVIKLVQGAGQDQPVWLQPWFNFWISSVTSAPAAYLYGIGLIELALGFALVIGLLRKSAYFGGIILSLMIWAIDEGFGGPYGPGATDIGAAIMYVFIFVAIIIVELWQVQSFWCDIRNIQHLIQFSKHIPDHHPRLSPCNMRFDSTHVISSSTDESYNKSHCHTAS